MAKLQYLFIVDHLVLFSVSKPFLKHVRKKKKRYTCTKNSIPMVRVHNSLKKSLATANPPPPLRWMRHK